MAKISNFLYCLNVERTMFAPGKGESINAVGVLAVLNPEYVPGSFSFSIVFSIWDLDEASENSIKIIFKDNNNEEIVNTGDITLPKKPADLNSKLPSQYIGYNLSMDFRNVVFKNEGEYTTYVYFNDMVLGKYPIFVRGVRSNES